MKGECKICKCTDTDCNQCVEKTGGPCFWIDENQDVCSACMYRDHAITLIQNLANASGAEFEDKKMAVDIIEYTIKKIVETVIDSEVNYDLIKKTLK